MAKMDPRTEMSSRVPQIAFGGDTDLLRLQRTMPWSTFLDFLTNLKQIQRLHIKILSSN